VIEKISDLHIRYGQGLILYWEKIKVANLAMLRRKNLGNRREIGLYLILPEMFPRDFQWMAPELAEPMNLIWLTKWIEAMATPA